VKRRKARLSVTCERSRIQFEAQRRAPRSVRYECIDYDIPPKISSSDAPPSNLIRSRGDQLGQLYRFISKPAISLLPSV
jgi:hypothetical protein